MESRKKQKEYEVEDIIDFDGEKYTVKWKGYKRTTKEPIENLENCMDLVDAYHRRVEESTEPDRSDTRVEHFGYYFGKGIIIFNTKKGRIARTFREALNTDCMAVANYLSDALKKSFNS